MNIRFFAVIAAILIVFCGNLAGADYRLPENFVVEQETPVLSARAENYLAQKADDGEIKIWVYFTDKGIFNEDQLSVAANRQVESMTEKALQRRAKNGAQAIRLSDLPVEQAYIDQVEAMGLKLHRISRWINAASFTTTPGKLEHVAELPFVRKIDPVATYVRPNPVEQPEPSQDMSGSEQDQRSYNYGDSYDQLEQINTIEAHDSGYTGLQVWVAMFDTGFRKSHNVFSFIMLTGRLEAEWDFVFDDGETSNEPEDYSSAWNHGTYTWSTLGGGLSNNHYGPAFNARFVLCKTEDVRSETEVEEDNWVAAIEWVDSIGVDIVSSSLGYTDWYQQSDFDGNTCVTTIAADYAASVGILVVNAAGNEGSGSSTLIAPADADSILTVGAVSSSGSIAYFSSRGPTADGRIKPEVCARGVSTHCAGSNSDSYFTSVNGTSLSTPLVGGAAAQVMQAHPDWTVMQVREALMMTADNASTPNNTYGWGIIDVAAAIEYTFEPPPDYMQGDANYDSLFNVTDAVYIINYTLASGPAPEPVVDAGDANDDGTVDISDAAYLINWIFVPGSPPPPGYAE